MSNFEITEVVLVHCNIVNNKCQKNSRALYAFVCDKSFGQLLEISLKNFMLLRTFDSELLYIEEWFTYQNSKPQETENKIDITLVINQDVKHKKFNLEIEYSVQPRDIIRGYGFLSFARNMGKSIRKNVRKNVSGKYSQKLPDHAKKICNNCTENRTGSKRAIQKRQKQLVI